MSIIKNFAEYAKILFRVRKDDYIHVFDINEAYNHNVNMIKNKVLMRGLESEIEEMFNNIDNIPDDAFWKAVHKDINDNIMRIHSHAPADLVETLQKNTMQEFNYLRIEDKDGNPIKELNEIFDEIISYNNLRDLMDDVIKNCLGVGDGAIRLNFINNEIKLDFVDGSNVEFDEEAIIFRDSFKERGQEYILLSVYTPGRIHYELYANKLGDDYSKKPRIPLFDTEKTKNLQDIEFKDNEGNLIPINFAIKTILFKSNLFKGRGESVLDGQECIINALDETLSTMVQDGVRNGRSKIFASEQCMKHNDDGQIITKYNAFNSNIILKQDKDIISESYQPTIDFVQPNIDISRYEGTFKYLLNILVGRWTSIASVNWSNDVIATTATEYKLRNETTIESVQKIERGMNKILDDLAHAIINAYFVVNFKKTYNEDFIVDVDWSEIGAPAAGELIDLMAKAAPGKQTLTYEEIARIWKPQASEEEIMEYAKELERINGENELEFAGFDENIDEEKIEE